MCPISDTETPRLHFSPALHLRIFRHRPGRVHEQAREGCVDTVCDRSNADLIMKIDLIAFRTDQETIVAVEVLRRPPRYADAL